MPMIKITYEEVKILKLLMESDQNQEMVSEMTEDGDLPEESVKVFEGLKEKIDNLKS